MRERPILFSAPMVRALLDGSKTQTRRVAMHTVCGVRVPRFATDGAPEVSTCPYGVPGDRLWVKETWQYADWTDDGQPYIRYAADNHVRFCEGAGEGDSLVDIWCHLSSPDNYEIDGKAADRKWRPSIHMPRWASRLTLEITDVRVERLQEMAAREERGEGMDALAEGIECVPDELGPCYGIGGKMTNRTGYAAFARLWNSINGDGSWNANPWVWVVSFTPEVRRA
jgi:hypothetical protein